MKVVWSPLAVDRVREHARFIERHNLSAAREWISDIFDVAEALASFPQSGRVVPEVGRADIRELIHDGYRIIYRIETNQVAVLTVRHARQQLPPDEIDEVDP